MYDPEVTFYFLWPTVFQLFIFNVLAACASVRGCELHLNWNYTILVFILRSSWYFSFCLWRWLTVMDVNYRESSQRRATVSLPWTGNAARWSTSWPRSTAWRASATTASPNATWSSQLTSKARVSAARVKLRQPEPEMWLLSRHQGEGGLSQINPDVRDRAGDGGAGASPHRSY